MITKTETMVRFVPMLPARAQRRGGRLSWFAGIVDGVLEWQERARQRAALRSMDERMLRDIGITRADAMTEVEKPFWRL